MSNAPEAPPIYRTMPLPAGADAAVEAVRAAAAGADPATLFWVDRSDRAQCAVTLSPDEPLRRSAQLVYVAMAALGDGLAAALPPFLVVGFDMPDKVLLNEAELGRVRVLRPADCAADAVPGWLVAAIDIGVTRYPEGSAEAADLTRTTFEDEGCMGVSAGEVSGAFARYLLSWIDRWQRDGFAPVRTSWLTYASLDREAGALRLGGRTVVGRAAGLSDGGDLLLETPDGEQAVAAAELTEAFDGAAG